MFASTYTNLIGVDGLVCTFFNESMLDKLGMNTPYQLVRDGKWTLDVFGQYMKAGANLNGDDTYGIVPLPKYNEKQKEYYTFRTSVEPLLTLPITYPDPASAGIIMDAMAYESYANVLPVYYEYRMNQKSTPQLKKR